MARVRFLQLVYSLSRSFWLKRKERNIFEGIPSILKRFHRVELFHLTFHPKEMFFLVQMVSALNLCGLVRTRVQLLKYIICSFFIMELTQGLTRRDTITKIKCNNKLYPTVFVLSASVYCKVCQGPGQQPFPCDS